MYRQGQAEPSARQGPPICVKCGVVAPTQHPQCGLCGTAFTYPRVHAPAASDGTFWAAVRCSFQCRSCHFLSPLNGLDMDGSVECAQCGMHQRFDVEAWREALAFSHGVADLAYPPPEGRHPHPHIWIGNDNPHAQIGYTEVFGEHRQSSTSVEGAITVHRSLFIQASPGHPTCKKCGRSVTASLSGHDVETRCDSCGETAKYRLPQQATHYAPPIRGVVSNEERVDKPRARLETVAGGPVTLKCAECGGNLPATSQRVLECPYCKAACLIPSRALVRDPGEPIEPDIWWLAFTGRSDARTKIESPTLKEEGALKKLAGGVKTYLVEAPKKPVRNTKQLLLALVLPSIAMLIGAGIYAVAVLVF